MKTKPQMNLRYLSVVIATITLVQIIGLNAGLAFQDALVVALLLGWLSGVGWQRYQAALPVWNYKATSPSQRTHLLAGLDPLAVKEIFYKTRGLYRFDRRWFVVDKLGGAVLIFLPALALALLHQRWSTEALVTWVELALMGIGWIIWRRWRQRRLQNYHCLQCAQLLPRRLSPRLEFECPRCNVLWRVGG